LAGGVLPPPQLQAEPIYSTLFDVHPLPEAWMADWRAGGGAAGEVWGACRRSLSLSLPLSVSHARPFAACRHLHPLCLAPHSHTLTHTHAHTRTGRLRG
jgi:hypothetical protein